MAKQTKGSIEADVANALVKFQREQQGRGPKEVRAQLIADIVIVRSFGIFTATEENLSTTEEGRRLIESARRELRSITKANGEQEVSRIVGTDVVRSFYDIDVKSAIQVEIYVFSEDVEKRMLRQDLEAYSASAPKRTG